MAKKYDDIGGVWRTIGGRRVFIKDGQDLASAMKESGKFRPSASKNKYSGYTDKEIEKQKDEIEKKAIDKEIEKQETNKKIKETSKQLEKEGKKEFGERNKNKEDYIKQFNEKYNNKEFYNESTKEVINAETMANEYIKHGGSESFEDFAKRRTKGLKEQNKYAVAKHEGFGDYNKDNIPVYQNKIDYTGDFGRNADLSTLSNKELQEAIKVQTEELNKAKNEKIGDQRTRNGRMDKIFNTAKVQKYEEGVKLLKEEAIKRENDKYPQYKGTDYEVKYYSVEDVMKDSNSKMNQYIREQAQKKAYKKYLKLHPNSKIKFEQFKDMNSK